MPGMGHGIDIHNPFVVNLFHHHMSVQLMVILAFALLFSVAALIRNLSRLDVGFRESRGRTFMRVGLGLLWLLDGLLQIQGDMPLGLASQVLDGSKDQSPSWMHGPINVAVNLWNQHPVALATSVTWIQIGIGLLLIASSRRLGRMAAAFSVLWAFVVWVTAGCGGVLGSEASLLFGWPGAPVFYGVMGVLVALEPATFQHAARLTSSKVMGIVLVLGGLIQLRPGTGAWSQGSANAINAMVSDMTSAHQPGLLRHVVRAMGTIARATGPGLNLAVALGAIGLGVAWWVARSGPTRRLVALTGMSALVVWVLVQDTGLFGGLSTDPNSMLPLALLAFSNLPSLRTEEPWRDVLGVAFRRGVGSSIASIGSAMLLVGVSLGAWVSVRPAEATIFEAQNGGATRVKVPAPEFRLATPDGQLLALSDLRGHVTVVTFLDPKCYQECPTIGHQLVQTQDALSGTTRINVVAVAANMKDHSDTQVRHFIERNGFASDKNFYFLNGTNKALSDVFDAYGVTVLPGGEHGMSIHTDVIYVIDQQGFIRSILTDDPAPGSAGMASTVTVLRGEIERLLKP